MRSVFIKKLHETMRYDSRLFLLIGDSGFNLVEPMFQEFPDRTLNVGIAEQNLIGISAGLANTGFRPVCYAISNFLVHRCLEQIRNDLCVHDYPVILIGTSTGFDNGGLWVTHYVVDDIGCLKPLPNIQIYSPSSIESINDIFDEIINSSHPAYIRIPKCNFSEQKATEKINRFVVKNDNPDILVVSHGKMIKNSVEAHGLFPEFSIFAIDRIKPLPEKEIRYIFNHFRHIIVVEDNFKSGLYNSLCEALVESKATKPNLYFIGPPERYDREIGDAKYLEGRYGLSPEKISAFIRNF